MTSKKTEGKGDVYFFGGVDRKTDQEGNLNPDGKVLSEYPAWMHTAGVEDLTEEIARDEKNIARYKREGIFDSESLFKQSRSLEAKKAKLQLILESKPKLSGGDKDKLYQVYNDLGSEIREGLFTGSAMKMGTASAHEEAARMIDKKISIDKLGISPQMAKDLNMRLEDGKASRSDLERSWKILGKYFGEATNTEVLRRDRVTARGRGGE